MPTREAWDDLCAQQLEEYNKYIAQGPTKFVRSTWEAPQHIYGGDQVFDRTRTVPRVFRYTINDFVG